MNGLVLVFVQVVLMVDVALAFGQIARKFGQPVVLGEILGGIIIG